MKTGLTIIFLGICTLWDLKKKQIWWSLPVFFLIAAIPLQILTKEGTIPKYLTGMIPGGALLLFAWITREAIGYGDGLILSSCGAMLGMRTALQILMMALCFSAVCSGFLLAVRKAGRKDQIPFVPFMLAAELVLVLTG